MCIRDRSSNNAHMQISRQLAWPITTRHLVAVVARVAPALLRTLIARLLHPVGKRAATKRPTRRQTKVITCQILSHALLGVPTSRKVPRSRPTPKSPTKYLHLSPFLIRPAALVMVQTTTGKEGPPTSRSLGRSRS